MEIKDYASFLGEISELKEAIVSLNNNISRLSSNSSRESALLLTGVDAAKYLGVSPSTLYRLRDSGKIKGVSVSSTERYPLSELNRYLQAQGHR